jgi:cob(I)alamin adenosyltransferase
MKIYTKTGDSGETSLFDNTRVSKADARVDAYGEVDELNACLGAARAAGVDEEIAALIESLQKDLFALGARLADPGARIAPRVAGALLHLARTVCRRAERRVIGLGAGAVDPVLIIYLNRLSDLLFVMARAVNHRSAIPETEW